MPYLFTYLLRKAKYLYRPKQTQQKRLRDSTIFILFRAVENILTLGITPKLFSSSTTCFTFVSFIL